MNTIRLILEYDGTAYLGWQRQAQPQTIQQTVEEALARIVAHPVVLQGSGRTDAGVHARGMVAHFRTPRELPMSAFREGVNRYLPPDIAVRDAALAPPDFHARFDARGKWYRYTLQNGAIRSPLTARQAWHVRPPLDLAAMQRAVRDFVGCHDFAPFRTANCDAKTTEREIYSFAIKKEDELLVLDVRGNGFLRHMVRLMCGTLVEIGLQRRSDDSVRRLLAGEAPLRSLLTAPPQGLCLMEVYYE